MPQRSCGRPADPCGSTVRKTGAGELISFRARSRERAHAEDPLYACRRSTLEAKMRQGSQWIGENAARFAALWFAALTLGAFVIPGDSRWFPTPHSLLGLLTLPLALCIMVFLAA